MRQVVLLVFVRSNGDQVTDLSGYGAEGTIQVAEALLSLGWGTTRRAEVWVGRRLEWSADNPCQCRESCDCS